MMKVVGAIAAMVLVAGIIVAIGMWRGLIPVPSVLLPLLVGGGEREHTARYYPPDTLAYVWATLVPAGGQFEELQDIWERLDDSRAFRNLVDLAEDEFEEETGIDFETGVMSWIGPEFSAGLLEADWRDDEWVVAGMVGVRDENSAEAFLRDWLDYMESRHYAEFNHEIYKDFDIVVSDDGSQVYALTGDWLVFATSERGLEDVLARLAGDEEDTLASNEDFMEARSHLTERRFASAYVSLLEANDLLEDVADDTLGPSEIGWVELEAVGWITASAGVADAAVVMEVAGPSGIDYPLEVADLDDPSSMLSDETLGFVAATFDPDVDHWRASLRRYDIGDFLGPDEIEGLSEIVEALTNEFGSLGAVRLDEDDGLDVLLDLGMTATGAIIGIDLEDDLLDHLGGEVIVAVGDVDFDGSQQSVDESSVDAVVMTSYRDGHGDDLAATIDDAVDRFAAFADLDTDTRDVGADERAVVIDLDGLGVGSNAYRPGYVLHDGYLTVGSTVRSLEGVVERQNGDVNALSAEDKYQRALRLLPEQRQFIGYVDLHGIIRRLDGEELALSRDQYRVLEDSIGVLAMSSYSPHCADSSRAYECELPAGADVSRFTVVLTLFPE